MPKRRSLSASQARAGYQQRGIERDQRGPVRCGMVKEGTPGKYQLRAVLPGSRRPKVEQYATREQVEKRRVALENGGYSVVITLPLDDRGNEARWS
jgi:hypothetical protein